MMLKLDRDFGILKSGADRMKLKKLNAILAVLSAVAFVVHIGYTSYAYLTMCYNPTLLSYP